MKLPTLLAPSHRSPADQAITATIWAYLGIGFGALNFIILFPRFLSIEEVGLVRLIAAGALIYIKLAFFGLDTSAVRFLAGIPTEDAAYQKQWRLLFVLSLIGMVVTSAIALPVISHYWESSRINAVSTGQALMLILGLCIAMLCQRFGESIAQVAGLTAQAAFWRDLAPRISMMLGAVGIFFHTWTFGGFLFLWTGSYTLGALRLNHFATRHRLHPHPLGPLPALKKIAETLRFACFSFIGTAAAVVQTTLDSIMLASLSTLTELGLYAPFAYAASLIDIPYRSLTAACYPRFQNFLKVKDYASARSLFSDVSFIQLTTGGGILILIWLNTPLLLLLLDSPDYQSGAIILLTLGAGYWVTAAMGQASQVLLCTKHFRLHGILNACAVPVGILLNFLLIPSYGAQGAAIATSLTLVFASASKGLLVWRAYQMHPFSRAYVKVAAILSVMLILNLLCPQPALHPIIACAMRTIITALIIAAVSWKLDLISQFRQTMNRLHLNHG